MKQLEIVTTGVSAPVFLWAKAEESYRFYIDVQHAEVAIELSYSSSACKRILFEPYPVGKLNSDFAFEAFGVSAIRLRVLKMEGEHAEVALTIEKGKCNGK